ncbi:MAG: hypothetical protein GJV46_15280 [Geobacter sp.]|nr:hypothetical protein [Geobacter sp.]
MAAAGLEPFERITLLFCLSKDPDQAVKSSAIDQLKILPEDVVAEYSVSDSAHPQVLDTVMRILSENVSSHIAPTSNPSPNVLDVCSNDDQDELSAMQQPIIPVDNDVEEDEASSDEAVVVDEEGEEFLSKYKISQMMGIGEKIKMALSGDKEWRSILIKDTNKLVSGSVMKNPRITEAEVLKLIKAGVQNDEIMRLICANKEWIKSYQIRKSLIENNRTPVQSAIRYLATMGEKDLAGFAKSKNITSVISTMAKRMLLNKKR